MLNRLSFASALLVVLGVSAAGCGTTSVSPSGNGVVSEKFDDGFPKWYDMPRNGLPAGMIAGVGRSDIADVDVEGAKSEAETIARSKIAEELETNIVKSANSSFSTASKKPRAFDETIKSVVAKRIVGARVDEFQYFNKAGKQDRIAPKTVLVRIILDIDIKALATDLGSLDMSDQEKKIFTGALAENFGVAPAATSGGH